MPFRPRIWGLAALLLAGAAWAGFYRVIWNVYRSQVLEYGTSPYTVGPFESSFYYWLSGFGLLATVGLTVGLGLLLPEGFRLPNWSPVLIPLVVVLALGVKLLVLGQSSTVDEENVYHFTARLLAHGRLALSTAIPTEVFGPRWGWTYHEGRWFGIYSYGWPLLLAVGGLLRAPWLLNPLLAGLSLWLAAAIARRAWGQGAAACTLVLLSAAPFFVLTSATGLASPMTATGVLAGILSVLRYLEDGRPRWLALCGVAGGWALLARPIPAMALLAPWWILLLWRERRPARLAAWLSPLALAVLLSLILNARLTGSAFETPYHAALRDWGLAVSSSTLGFGADYRAVGGIGVHTVSQGLLNGFLNLLRLNHWLLGWPLSLLLVSWAPWNRWTKLLLGGVILRFALATTSYYPGVNVTGPSEYFEVACVLTVLAAAGLSRLEVWYRSLPAARVAPHAATALGFAILAVNLGLFAPVVLRSLRPMSQGSGLLARTLRERVTGPAVVFVGAVQGQPGSPSNMSSYVYFAPLNASLDDAVILLQDRGPEQNRAAWKQDFPGRRAYRYETGPDWKPVLEELP